MIPKELSSIRLNGIVQSETLQIQSTIKTKKWLK